MVENEADAYSIFAELFVPLSDSIGFDDAGSIKIFAIGPSDNGLRRYKNGMVYFQRATGFHFHADTVKRFRIKFKPLKFKNRNLKPQILKFTTQ